MMGPGVAMECIETKDGPTIWEDYYYPEIIDPVTLEVLPDGEIGELVLTGLQKEALPIIRYRTRDLTRLLPGTARPMRRLERITARSDDMMIIRGINVYPTQIEELVLKVPQLSETYEIHLTRRGNLDSLSLHVEFKADYQGLSDDVKNRALQELSKHFKNYIGINAEIIVRPCYSIKRSEGKAARVFDQRKAS